VSTSSPRLLCGSREMVRRRAGFTLIEIMIVLAVVSLLAALAINSMLRSRMEANEVSAVGSLRVISSATQAYYNDVTPHTYPVTLAAMGLPTSNPEYVGADIASGTKSGYTLVYNREDAENFTCLANPTTVGRTGDRYFYVDESGRITAKTGGVAGPADPPVE
jgi:type IV pilus assembly protein PilA